MNLTFDAGGIIMAVFTVGALIWAGGKLAATLERIDSRVERLEDTAVEHGERIAKLEVKTEKP